MRLFIQNPLKIAQILAVIALASGLFACSSIPGPAGELAQTDTAQAAVTSTPTQLQPSATPTPVPPTATATSSPTATATETLVPTPTQTPTDTPPPPTPSGEQAVYIYGVQTGTGGPVACGDSLIKINTGAWRTGDVAQDVATALRKLLVKSQYLAGLYNPVYLSNMQVVSVDFDPGTGTVTVNLTGSYVRSGDRCDDGRVRAQIWTTIRQFPGVRGNPLIFLDGNLLGDILSTARDK